MSIKRHPAGAYYADNGWVIKRFDQGSWMAWHSEMRTPGTHLRVDRNTRWFVTLKEAKAFVAAQP
jgi:hypothetical protein